jgi:hypothetical protein
LGLKELNERGPSFSGLVVPVQEIFAQPWLLGLVQNIFPHRTLFQFFVPIAQQSGQAAVLGRLSLSMCLCSVLTLAEGSHYFMFRREIFRKKVIVSSSFNTFGSLETLLTLQRHF